MAEAGVEKTKENPPPTTPAQSKRQVPPQAEINRAQSRGNQQQQQQPMQIVRVGPGQMQYAIPAQALIPYFAPIKGVGPGLEALALASGIYIQQEMNLVEILLPIEMNNRYSVVNSMGQRLYFAAENTPCGERFCWGQNRVYQVTVFDGMGKPVMSIDRKRNCTLCCWGGRIGGTHVTVTLLSTGEKLGTVVQDCNYCTPTYHIRDPQDKILMRINGPGCGTFCYCIMCGDVRFQVTNEETKQEVGFITKHFRMVEMISDVNAFGLNFEQNMDPNQKAVLLAAVFCLDFSFFEGRNGLGGGSRGMNFSGCCLVTILIIVTIQFAVLFIVLFGLHRSDNYYSRG